MADYLPSPEEIRAEAARIREENARKAAAEGRAPLESRAKPSKPYRDKTTGASKTPAPDHPWRKDVVAEVNAARLKATPAPDPTPEIAAERPSHPYRGITYKPKKRIWIAQTKPPGPGTKSVRIGAYKTAEAAARGYDAYIVKHGYGKPLNFPTEHPGHVPAPEGAYRMRKRAHEGKAEQFVARLSEAEERAAPAPREESTIKYTMIDANGEEKPFDGPSAVTVTGGPKIAAPPLPPGATAYSVHVSRPEPTAPPRSPEPDLWTPLQAKLDAAAELLAVLRRHPREAGIEALKLLTEVAS